MNTLLQRLARHRWPLAGALAVAAFLALGFTYKSREQVEPWAERFRKAHGDVVMKPLYGHGGAAVFKVTPRDPNFGSLFDLPRTGRYRFVEADVTKVDLVPLLRGADAVVQLAAITDAAGSFDRAREVENNNFHATRRIAETCAELGIALIAPSSTSVYGTQKTVVDEDCGVEDLKPQSPYAETKLKEEDLLGTLFQSGLKVVRLRLGTIFGTSPGMRFHTAVNKFCWQAVFGVPLTVWRTAYDQRRPYLDLSDAVRAIVAHMAGSPSSGSAAQDITTKAVTPIASRSTSDRNC